MLSSLFHPIVFVTLLAFISGMIFGFLLKKGAVFQFDVIVGQFLLKDFTVMKVMLTAIVTASLIISSLHFFGWIPKLILSTTPLILSALGGAIFGIGMSLSGYCPGTGIVALAEGSKEVIYGLIGMLFGSILYNKYSFFFLPLLNKKDFFFQKTLPSYLNLSTPLFLSFLILAWLLFYTLLERKKSKEVSE